MKGRRADDGIEPHQLAPGEYVYWRDQWWGCTPNGHLCNLVKHDVTQHADRTITVSPSILVKMQHAELYHGYLRAGVWSNA